ncbi:LacI family DNA-binding transcriptional regulator [Luteipulveratus halotolerans]|uniref:HTH lacI-type domain-containing protein n=1 Tax=Luteipulveratus halotolerans TaxID=1631356 RepID=A0A0L6CLW7_9MICO|nr:LacI family DNA-binding transcriptional regulator [Luteipulveratus halotolerans]KNX38513.1 hypothetical protein VV01_17350 [Luteipulveratus halotolerans]
MPVARESSTRPPRITLRDVAARAGVAMSTASLVYSGKKPVAQATADKVRAAADELGYQGPDPLASSLRHGRSGVVGAVVPARLIHAFRDPYAVLLCDGLAQSLSDLGSGLLLMPEPDDGDQPPGSSFAVDAVVFLLCSAEQHPLVPELARRGIPMIATGSPIDPHVTQLSVDDRGASARLARHLRDLGHQRVGHVLMPLGQPGPTRVVDRARVAAATYPITRDRAYGVLDVLGDGVPMVCAETASVEHGREAAGLLLDLDPRPTAIIAQSDLLAAGVIQAAAERGLRVPDDLSVTGYDGVELPWLGHRLTTIDQHPVEKGRLAGDLVRRALAGEHVTDVTMTVDLRVGDTTGPA